MDRFRSILNSTFVTTYKRTITVLFIFALTLAIPVTILLVQQQQDIRQQAASNAIATIKGFVKDQTGQPVNIPGASVSLVNVAGGTPRPGNIKPDGSYSFQIFAPGTFRLGIKLPPNYRIDPTSTPVTAPITITKTTKNIPDRDFNVIAPTLTDKNVAGRFNKACLDRFSGWACVIGQDPKKVKVKFYKGTSSSGQPILFTPGSDLANKEGRSETLANPPEDPVGAEKACGLPQNLADHHVYYFKPLAGQVTAGDQVVGFMTSVIDPSNPQIQPLALNIQMKGRQPKTVLAVDNPLCIDDPQKPAKKYTISGTIFVNKKGKVADNKYDAVNDRPYGQGANVVLKKGGKNVAGITNPVTSGTGGKYTFIGLTPGDYTVEVVNNEKAPARLTYLSYTPKSLPVKVVGANLSGNDFGYKLLGEDPVAKNFRIAGTVFVKIDAKRCGPADPATCKPQPASQRPYKGAARIALTGKNVKDVAPLTTDNEAPGIGSYSFKAVPAGSYKVEISLTPAALNTYTILAPKTIPVTVTNANQLNKDFFLKAKDGVKPPEENNFAISGIVYVEKSPAKDVQSVYNPAVDELFNGANVSLQTCLKKPVLKKTNTEQPAEKDTCAGDAITSQSNADGKYQFIDQASQKRYTVSLTLPEGYRAANALSRSFNLVKDRNDVNFGIIKKTDGGPVVPGNLAISIKMPGIGLGTDNNNNPLRPDREAEIAIYDSANDELVSQTTTVTYDPALGIYKGTIVLDQVPGGTYAVKARLDNTLFRFFRSPETNNPLFDIAPNTTTTLPTLTLIAGDLDINQDLGQQGLLDVFDYDRILSCMRNEDVCTEDGRILADFNDDGTLDDGRDLNILFQGLGVRVGE